MKILQALLPRDESFFEYFERHAERTVAAADALRALLDDFTDVGEKARRLKEIEREGDEIKHAALDALHRTFITPLDRDEIQTLVLQQDKVLDLVHGVGELLAMYEVPAPTPHLRDLVRVLAEAIGRMRDGVGMLRDLRDPAPLLAVCREIHRLENEADTLRVAAEALLFREEKDAITVMKWKEIYETAEEATDRVEVVADVLHAVVLEYA